MRTSIFGGALLSTALSLTAQSTTGFLVDSNLDQLFSVDVSTGAATLIGSTANNGLGTPADLSWRTVTAELWTIDLAGGEVGTIDVTNGTFTPVYQTNLSGWQGMAWDETTQLFYLANQNGTNYTLDPATGVTTVLGAAGFGLITCLDTDASGNLFGIDFTTGSCVQVDKTTGIATATAATIGGFQGLGIDQATSVWYGANTNDDSLHVVDPATGTNTVVGPHGAGVVFAKGFDLVETGANFATKVNFGTGCNSTFASFYESGPFDLSGTSLMFNPAGLGYVVLPGSASIVPPTNAAVTMGDDAVLSYPLGFTLPIPGGSTTDVWVSSNGFCNATTNTANGCCLFNLNQFLSNGPCWSALWDDLNPAAGGTVTFETDTVNNIAYITFDQVPEFGTSNLNTFQYQFHDTGLVEIVYGACAVSVAGVGWSPGQGNLNPGSIDISMTPVIITSGVDVLPLSLSADARPVINTTVTLTVGNVPSGTAIGAVIYGLAQYNPGLPLPGMPDCFQFCSQEAVALTIAPTGPFTNAFPIPNDPGLSGVHIQAQGAIFNPGGMHNALDALSSNAIDFGIDLN